MILCDDEDDDDDEEEEDDDGEEDEDDFLATYHPLFWAQPPQLALVIHLLNQHIFAPTCFCIKIFCTKIHFRFKIQIHTHDNDVIHLVLLVNLNFPAFLRFSKKKYTWELSSYLVQPGAHISKYIGQPFKLSFTHVQCPLDV